MAAASNALDLSACVGHPIAQIRVDPFSTQFCFHSGHIVSTQGIARTLQRGVAISEWTEKTGWKATNFQTLLHRRVTGYRLCEDSKVLEISFEDELLLRIEGTFSVQPGNYFSR
jgi:hypothetical protein